jgi:hypothetical protein
MRCSECQGGNPDAAQFYLRGGADLCCRVSA